MRSYLHIHAIVLCSCFLFGTFRAEHCSQVQVQARANNYFQIPQKNSRHFVERKSLMLFNNLIYLMSKCDKYIDAWQFRKKNLNFYLVSKGDFFKIVKARRDLVREIESRIDYFDKKKMIYAAFIGKLYNLAEPFIESTFLKLGDEEVNLYVERFIKEVGFILPDTFSDDYFNDELQELKKFAPQHHKNDKILAYGLGVGASLVVATLLVAYRKSLYNLGKNFLVNQVYKPLRNLKNCLFSDASEYDLLDMSAQELLQDIEAQKNILKDKIKAFILESDPEVSPEALESILQEAKKEGFESFVTQCIQKASQGVHNQKNTSKQGWLEWLFIGNRLRNIFGMPLREKFLEIEIKALLSRLAATKLLYEAKDGIDSNKLTMVLGSLLPVSLVGYGCYKLYQKLYGAYYGIPKKKRDINEIIFKMSDIVNRNMGNKTMSEDDQGLLCYLAHRFKLCLSVVAENIRESFEKDLSYISSVRLADVNKKLQILQSMKIMLYTG